MESHVKSGVIFIKAQKYKQNVNKNFNGMKFNHLHPSE